MNGIAQKPLPGHPRTRSGFTLTELLFVLVVVAILTGIGVAGYLGFLGVAAIRSEQRAVTAILQTARSTAQANGCDTIVVVDRSANEVFPFRRTKVGVWNFEPPGTHGAFGQVAIAHGGDVRLTEGWVGRGLELDGSYHLECQASADTPGGIPTYDTHEGIAIEAAVRPVRQSDSEPTDGSELTVIERPGWFRLALRYDAESDRFAVLGAATTLAEIGGNEYLAYEVETEPAVPMNRWTLLRLVCHSEGPGIQIYVDGRERAPSDMAVETTAAPSSSATTTIAASAGGENPFFGRLDEVVVSAYIAESVRRISERITLDHNGIDDRLLIWFDASGRLITAAGAPPEQPPKVYLRQFSGDTLETEVTITVDPMGAIRVETTSD